MFKDFASADAFVEQNKIQMVDLKFSDLWGRWHHVTIPRSEFTEELMSAGVGLMDQALA
jgi:glutamine synthetase